MVGTRNPFRPGFAERPAYIGGRDEVLAAGDEAFEVVVQDRRTPMPIFAVGPRGVGKTVVLDEIARRGGAVHGWPNVSVEASASSSLLEAINAEAARTLEIITETRRDGRLTMSEAVVQARIAGVGAEVRLRRNESGASLESLDRLVSTLDERSSGLVLVVDEAHSATPADFGQLAARIQMSIRRSAPLVAVIGGLPALRRRPAESEESLGYLERADWHDLSLLDRPDAVSVLVETAKIGGLSMVPAVGEHLAELAGGYPYALQVYGKHAWRVALEGSATAEAVTVDHARAAVRPAERELARTLYEGRWSQTSQGARSYLQAVAELEGEGERVTGRAVAERLGRSPRALSMVRARLLDRGTLVANGDRLQLMVPGFAAWVRSLGEAR